MVKDVRVEINQINRILTDLLETARPHPPQMMRSNLNTTVEHAVMLARQQVLSRPITIELQRASDLGEVEHDSDQIHQVVLNLLLNAVQAIDGPGAIRVAVGSKERSGKRQHLRGPASLLRAGGGSRGRIRNPAILFVASLKSARRRKDPRSVCNFRIGG